MELIKLSPEQLLSRELRSILANLASGTNISELIANTEVLTALEYFLPSELAKIDPYWLRESLDGFFISDARKIGMDTAKFTGVCILISDQTTTPFELRLKVRSSDDKIDWMECKLGAGGSGAGGMRRTPFPLWQKNHFAAMEHVSKGMVKWAYVLNLGHAE
jgi:hypothetical protein